MSWIAVETDKEECIFTQCPERVEGLWLPRLPPYHAISVPAGTAKKLTGKPMTWDDEPRRLI